MSDQIVAVKATYFSIFSILFLHSWISILFYINKVKSTDFLSNLESNFTISEKVFNNVLDIQMVNETSSCDNKNGYQELASLNWPGTIEGVYVGNKEYLGNECTFEDCTGQQFVDNYIKQDCYEKTYNNIRQVCCSFMIDTPFANECSNAGNSCICQDTYKRKSEYVYKKTTDRELILINSTESKQIAEFFGKKVCYKNITDFTLYDEKCENGKYCFEYVCIKGIETCPDYSQFFNMPNTKMISDININYNGIGCSLLSEKSARLSKIETKESEHYLSRMNSLTSQNEFCIFNNLTSVYEDVILLKSITSQEFYNMDGIYPLISKNIDQVTKDEKYKYTPFLTDIITISAGTHFNIDSSNANCRQDLFKKIEKTFAIAKETKGVKYQIFIYSNLGFLILIIGVNIYFFLRIKKSAEHENDMKTFRIVILSNLAFLAFNAAVYCLIHNDVGFLEGIVILEEVSNCFTNSELKNFLNNVKYGIFNFNEIYSLSLKKILIENSIVLAMLIIMITPICNWLKILGLKR